MFVKSLLLCLSLLCFINFSFADEAQINVYLDPECRESARDAIVTDIPFSNECQQLSDGGKSERSGILDCSEDSRGLVVFTYMVYNNTNMCADWDGGSLEFGLETYGPYESCMKTKLLENNRFTPVYTRVTCKSDNFEFDRNTERPKLQQHSASAQQGTAPRAPVMPKANAILERNKAMKKKNHHNHL